MGGETDAGLKRLIRALCAILPQPVQFHTLETQSWETRVTVVGKEREEGRVAKVKVTVDGDQRKLRENFEAKERKLREPDSTIFDII